MCALQRLHVDRHRLAGRTWYGIFNNNDRASFFRGSTRSCRWLEMLEIRLESLAQKSLRQVKCAANALQQLLGGLWSANLKQR